MLQHLHSRSTVYFYKINVLSFQEEKMDFNGTRMYDILSCSKTPYFE